MKTKFILIFISIISVLTSCQISEEYDFKNDLSGTYKLSVDFSELAKSDSSLVSKGKNNLENFNKVINILKKVEGLSNIKYNVGDKEGIISYSYDFKDLEALNNSLSESESKLKFPTSKFKKSFFGKIIYIREKIENVDKTDSKLNFSNLITYKTKFSFENEINNVKASGNDNYKVEKKSIIEKGDYSKMFANSRKFKISLKKQ